MNGAGLQLARSEQRLSGFENHAVVYFKQLVDEEPGAVGRALGAVTILKNPIPVNVFDGALQPAQLVVVELNVASRHTTDKDLFVALEGEYLVQLGSINEFQLDAVVGGIATTPILSLKEIHRQMRRAK